MKKILFILLLLPFYLKAQDNQFLLQSDATFKTQDGKDYIVVDCPGKTAKELYDLYLQRTASCGLQPQRETAHHPAKQDLVSNSFDGSSFVINACVDRMAETEGSMSIHMYGKYWACNYTLTLQFKDEKVRINAPKIDVIFFEKEKTLIQSGGKHDEFWKENYTSWCKQFCDFKKDGTPNPKNNCYNSTNNRMNEEIAKLFDDKQEDW